MKNLAIVLAVVAALGLVLIALLVYVAKKVSGGAEKKLRSVTRTLFITTQVAALLWVSVSYLIALYATVKLGQPFPVVELSQQAITTILGVNVLKVVENIFEHNDGKILGTSNKTGSDEGRTI